MGMGISMVKTKPDNLWDDVLSAASRLQGLVKEAVLVGGTASALFAAHRTSYDADHVIPNLRESFDEILENLESVAGWQTARIKKPVLILGSLDGIETGVRQLIRSAPLETMEIYAKGQKITVPTEAEILRIKGALILKRNATRDYLDFAALSKHLGIQATEKALRPFDELYPQPNGASPLQQLYLQLANPKPFDLEGQQLKEYKNLTPEWHDWGNVTKQCQLVASGLLNIKVEKEHIKKEMFDIKYEAKRSLGFTWKLPEQGLQILKAEDPHDALFTFHKYRVEHVCSTLQTLEHINCTIAQTRSILDGQATSGLSTRQLRAIENYGKACDCLIDLIEQNKFSLNKETVCTLHTLVGRDEARHCGRFRGHQVFIEQSNYIPPKSEYLEKIFTEGAAFLNGMDNAQEKAICSFLFLARSQLFSDCNKRTANLVLNGLLMQAGFYPLNIQGEQFLEKMAVFYETSDATEVIKEINQIAICQYRIDGAEIEARTQETRAEQQQLADADAAYDVQLKDFTQAKSEQADRLVASLEKQIISQSQRLQDVAKVKPNAISALWRGRQWQGQYNHEQRRQHELESRLSRVKMLQADTRRLERLAEAKLRREQKDLTAKRDAQLLEQRERMVKKNENSQNLVRKNSGRGRSLRREQ